LEDLAPCPNNINCVWNYKNKCGNQDCDIYEGISHSFNHLCKAFFRNHSTYFIQSGDFVKIGVSKDPKHRLVQLQTANPNKLRLIHTTSIPEAELHIMFNKYREKGEWFLFSQDIKDFIEEDGYCVGCEGE